MKAPQLFSNQCLSVCYSVKQPGSTRRLISPALLRPKAFGTTGSDAVKYRFQETLSDKRRIADRRRGELREKMTNGWQNDKQASLRILNSQD